MTLLTESVEIGNHEVVGQDDYGNDVYEWAWVPVTAWLEQVNSLENADRQEQTSANMRLYTELDAPIKHTSRVRWAGEEWNVNGRPGHQPGGFEVPGFRVAVLTLVED